jgi:hypothetical protein
VTNSPDGTAFTINKRFDSPTIQSLFYIQFGAVEVHLKASTGQGIISSVVLESDCLDEIDWEWMGGNASSVETNYFGKGNATSYDRAQYHAAPTPMDQYVNYTIDWTAERTQWLVDGTVVRTLLFHDALDGQNYPQTPMTVRLGIWAGGDASQPKGTIDWAGGLTDFTKVPFTMSVRSVRVSDYSTGKAYTYSDHSGSFQSIKSVAGNSSIAEDVQPGSGPATTASGWSTMSSGARVGVVAGASLGAAALFLALLFYCLRQRRKGVAERAAADAKHQAQRDEDLAYAGLDGKAPDALPMASLPQLGFVGPGAHTFYANAAGDDSASDLSSLYKFPAAYDPLEHTPPPLYHSSGFGSRDVSPSTAAAPPSYRAGYAPIARSPASSPRPYSPAPASLGSTRSHGPGSPYAMSQRSGPGSPYAMSQRSGPASPYAMSQRSGPGSPYALSQRSGSSPAATPSRPAGSPRPRNFSTNAHHASSARGL